VSERVRNVVAVGVIVASLAVVVAVLASSPPSDADRVHDLATRLKCPICDNESIASSPADLARELLENTLRRPPSGRRPDLPENSFTAQATPFFRLSPMRTEIRTPSSATWQARPNAASTASAIDSLVGSVAPGLRLTVTLWVV